MEEVKQEEQIDEQPWYDAEKEATNPMTNPLVVFLVALLIGGVGGFFVGSYVSDGKTAAPLAGVESSGEINEPDPHQEIMMTVIANARHFYGDENAPITIVEFGDFNCGYCGRWAQETLPQINENYVESGKVRIAYIHYPILGEDSMTASEAAECANEQGDFWEYHNLLYQNQGIGFTKKNLSDLAGELELDTESFESCLADFPSRASLEDDIRLAQVMGVRGTPAFLINGIPLAGAYPYEDFSHIIDGLLEGDF